MSTADSLAIQSYGYNNLYSDPSWQKYWMMSQQLDSLNSAAAGKQAQANTNTTSAASNPNFKGGATGTIPRTASGSGSNHALAATITVGTAIAGTAIWLASRGKAAGAKGFINSVGVGFNTLLGGGTKKAGKMITLRQVNGKNIYTIPGKAKTYRGTEITGSADELGLTINNGLKWTDNAARVRSAQIEFVHEGTRNRITFVNGKKPRCYNLDEHKVFDYDEAIQNNDFKDILEKAQTALKNKDESILLTKLPGCKFQNIVYGQEVAEGSSTLFVAAAKNPKSGKIIDDGLKVLKTNRFEQGADEVHQAMLNDKDFKDAVNALKGKKPSYDGWGVAEGSYYPEGIKNKNNDVWPDNTRINIKNNEIASITKDGIEYKPGTAAFDAMYEKFGAVFRDTMNNKDKFENVVRLFS